MSLKKFEDGWQKNAFNQYASDKMSLHRSLPDLRDEGLVRCINEKKIIILYNTIQYKTFVEGLNFVIETIHKPGKYLWDQAAGYSWLNSSVFNCAKFWNFIWIFNIIR